MIFQKVLKGISDLDPATAQDIVDKGILSNWWRKAGTIQPEEIKIHLTLQNADLHVNHYHKKVPATNPLHLLHKGKFGEVSPFISTTAGVVQRNGFKRINIIFPPFITALRFATKNYTTTGYIYYAYVITIGKVAVEMAQFSEEIRNLNVYTDYQRYNDQGEIMAKIIIPSVQIEKAELYDGPKALLELNKGQIPLPLNVIINTAYQAPEKLSNIHEVL